MQTLYAVHINRDGAVSVDVFSPKHSGAAKWRVYFGVRPLTLARLRRIFVKFPKRFYINREWSAERWKMYKRWGHASFAQARTLAASSLDPLATSEPVR